jgi:Tfp pilus assembly protein PilZ
MTKVPPKHKDDEISDEAIEEMIAEPLHRRVIDLEAALKPFAASYEGYKQFLGVGKITINTIQEYKRAADVFEGKLI